MVYKIDSDGATIANEWTNGNPSLGVKATLIDADWMNMLQRELVYIVEQAGLTLNDLDNTQLFQAVQALGGLGTISQNLASSIINMKFTYNAGTFSITGVNGNAFSSTNIGRINFQRGTFSDTIMFTSAQSFNDDSFAGTSDIINNWFGLTNGIAYNEDFPMYVYATKDTLGNPFTFLNMAPNLGSVSADVNRVSYKGTPGSTQDKFTSFFLASSVTPANVAGQPCFRIGAIPARKSAANDITIQSMNTDDYGVGQSPKFRQFLFPTGQGGAATSKYTGTNGPSWSNQQVYFSLGDDGYMDIDGTFSGTCTNGTDGVATRLYVPIGYNSGNSSSIIGITPTIHSYGGGSRISQSYMQYGTQYFLARYFSAFPGDSSCVNNGWSNAADAFHLHARYKAF